jgi:hypothetical protein
MPFLSMLRVGIVGYMQLCILEFMLGFAFFVIELFAYEYVVELYVAGC